MLFHPAKQCKGMSPVCAIAVSALAVTGAVSVFMLCKKKWGTVKKDMKKLGSDVKDLFKEECSDSCEL